MARLESNVNLCEHERQSHVKAARAATDQAIIAALWFEAVAAACQVSRYAMLCAERQSDVRKKRHFGRIAETRRAWAEDVLRKMQPFLDKERASWTGHLSLVVLPPVEVAGVDVVVG